MNVRVVANKFSSLNENAKQMLIDAGFDYKEYDYSVWLNEETLKEFIKDADAIVAGVEVYTPEILRSAPNLKILARRGVGIDNFPQDYCKENNIIITRTVGAVENAVAEMIIAFCLEFSRQINVMDKDLKNGKWKRILTSELSGKNLCILGYGAIGERLAIMAKVFNMNIYYNKRNRLDKEKEEKLGITYLPFDELVKTADFLSVNTPLTNETRSIINLDVINKMKKSAYIINTARGPVCNTKDLIYALENELIAGYATDVFDNEPCDPEFKKFTNVILTPHVGTFTYQSMIAMNERCSKEIIKCLKGE